MRAPPFAPPWERIALPLGDGAVAGWRWPSPGARQLVFLHATGFCARAYAPMLGIAQKGFDVFALDLRGHGRTSLPADPARLRSWNLYAEDFRRALDALPAPSAGRILSGHSCGAVVAALAAPSRREATGLALIEPVALPPPLSLLAKTPAWPFIAAGWPLVRGAKARRAVFPDRATAAESYGRKPLFARWAAGALDGYLDDGLIADGDGVRLACAPAWEAATFAAQSHDFWSAIARARAPVRVLAATDATTTTGPRAVRRLRRAGASVVQRPNCGHLVPLEDPIGAAEFLLDAAVA